MKSTLTIRNIANPRRTTLAHLDDADEMTTEAVAAQGAEDGRRVPQHPESATLPPQTANPRRTVLVDDPTD